MIITHLSATNWRNFRQIDVPLSERQFIVGPNASGKSNFLDIFRFLRDIAKNERGGLQEAVASRGSVATIQSLVVEQDAEIAIEIRLADTSESAETWRYAVGFRQAPQSQSYSHRYFASLTHERVWKESKLLIDRPDTEDEKDPDRLIRTTLESTNHDFQELVDFFHSIAYLHLVPQLLRFPDLITVDSVETDTNAQRSGSRSRSKSTRTQLGHGLLERIANVDEDIRCSRIKTIEEALKIAMPQLERLEFKHDEAGRPHLLVRCSHWHPSSPAQHEEQFSDGTLRLLGLLWALLESDSVLLLEEPELSLHVGIVSQLAYLIYKMQSSKNQQVLVSTHSDVLLDQADIDGTEVLMLTPTKSGTEVKIASDNEAVKQLLEADFTVGEVVLPRSSSENVKEMGQ
ncbi:MAG: AAA family ATPase [Candidatus Poribacteria bacterium]|nr:AAA family ATPase [Candidatus Poribacteria bacterium]